MTDHKTSEVRIGTCGFGGNKRDYAELFSVVEVQQTFYQPPQLKTLERWRAEVPADFEFTLKAWQLITHEAKSPTFRRLKRVLTEPEKAEAGSFKPTAIVRDAWETTLACAHALRATTILFQCPASFKPEPENVQNLERFFSGIERGGLTFGWEPRGAWPDDLVGDLCRDLDLWHVVDPLKARTVTPERCYFRLHGITGWRYKYREDELQDLATLLPESGPAYVFFNNIYMTEDAVRFREVLNAD